MLLAFDPIVPEAPRWLILGTFPSPVSRQKGEYYGHPRNQFWPLLFRVFGVAHDAPDYELKRRALIQNDVALWDVLSACEPDGALDTSIRNPVVNAALPSFVAKHAIERICFNGQNAYTFYRRCFGDTPHRILPSSSPANARMRFEEKAERWRSALLDA